MSNSNGWFKGIVKAVPSGDCLVIMGNVKADVPLERTITLANVITPKLAKRGGTDEPFAWDSREFLRKLCLGKEVVFKVEYNVPSIGREFGTVFLGDKNVASLIIAEGWAKIREPYQQKNDKEKASEISPYLPEQRALEEKAKSLGLGRWTTELGASEKSIRDIPPSAIGDPINFDAMGFVASNKGKPIEAIVEQVRDGHTLRAYLLPDFQFVQVFVSGVQAPLMGKRIAIEAVIETEPAVEGTNGDAPEGSVAEPLSAAQRVVSSLAQSSETVIEPFAREAKHFTEVRVLNRDVRIVLEGTDKNNNLIGSVYYPDGDTAKDLALELIKNGLGKYVEWSASMMEPEAKQKLKAAELQAKKDRVKRWINYLPPPSNMKPIHDQNFTGKVVEVISGDCIVVANDEIPFGNPTAERRVNLSSIKAPKIRNPKDQREEFLGREAKEFLRTRLIGRQVNVSMEYSRKIEIADGSGSVPAGTSRVMDFGSVLLATPPKNGTADQAGGINVAELLVSNGLATVIRHRDFEERSKYYDALMTAESKASSGKKPKPSGNAAPHIRDLSMGPAKKARDFLPFLQKTRRMNAVVEYVFSGHRFKLYVPKETCSISFSLSGVRAPSKNLAKKISEPYSDEALAFMRRKVLQRDVEIEIETVDRNGTFLGSVYESKTNVAIALLEEGLAKVQTSFGSERVTDAYVLARAEESAKQKKLRIWENYVEGEEATNGSSSHDTRNKETLKVIVTEVLPEGKFYVQTVDDQRVSAIQQQLAALSLKEAPVIGSFNPPKGSIVLSQFTLDNSWNRAMIVNGPRNGVQSADDQFEVFYIDYGNQETVPYSRLRPADQSVSTGPGLAQLCSLAFIKVPSLEDDFGQEAAEYLSDLTLASGTKEFKAVVEERDNSSGKSKGQGTGNLLAVSLFVPESETSINAALLEEGLARIQKRRFDTRERKAALEKLEVFQDKAKKERLNMWQYGDVQSDDEDSARPAGRR